MTFEELDKFTREKLLPSVSVDGGDIRAEKVEEDRLIFTVHGECAHCPACNDHFGAWIKGKVKRHFREEYSIVIKKSKPYFVED